MARDPESPDGNGENVFSDMLRIQAEASRKLIQQFGPLATPAALARDNTILAQWADYAGQIGKLWGIGGKAAADGEEAGGTQGDRAKAGEAPSMPTDPEAWRALVDAWYAALPFPDAEMRQSLLEDSISLWTSVLAQYGMGAQGGAEPGGAIELPRKDGRFADARWREQPVFAVLHQSYLLMSEQLQQAVERVEGLEPARKSQLQFLTRTLIEALSPANYALTNPVVLERTLETGGENLAQGMEHLLADLRNRQLTHTDRSAFEVGRNIATTPGKVVYENGLYQLIQYSPTTEQVLATPLVIFPAWVNRFYILDLSPKKSFVRWAVEQGLTVFIVSWKSADASMAETTWDDYIRAQIQAVDFVRERLNVQSVHTIGYCVAGTTLAATLAILARRGESAKIASATFFTAQVDFANAGDLKAFADEAHLGMVDHVVTDGYLDGRYMAAAFNLLRSSDLIWNYVIKNYLLGEEYPAFDLLYWNGDTTNLPAKWHRCFVRDLYCNNLLSTPDALSADGTQIDLGRIDVPCYIQAGREDHIAPASSVWKLKRLIQRPTTFLLAGSGHIAGVINPPAATKYQYWTNDGPAETLDEFIAGAKETPGSWWPHWIEWIRALDGATVPATGKRKPGGKGDRIVEDAPGRYVTER